MSHADLFIFLPPRTRTCIVATQRTILHFFVGAHIFDLLFHFHFFWLRCRRRRNPRQSPAPSFHTFFPSCHASGRSASRHSRRCNHRTSSRFSSEASCRLHWRRTSTTPTPRSQLLRGRIFLSHVRRLVSNTSSTWHRYVRTLVSTCAMSLRVADRSARRRSKLCAMHVWIHTCPTRSRYRYEARRSRWKIVRRTPGRSPVGKTIDRKPPPDGENTNVNRGKHHAKTQESVRSGTMVHPGELHGRDEDEETKRVRAHGSQTFASPPRQSDGMEQTSYEDGLPFGKERATCVRYQRQSNRYGMKTRIICNLSFAQTGHVVVNQSAYILQASILIQSCWRGCCTHATPAWNSKAHHFTRRCLPLREEIFGFLFRIEKGQVNYLEAI